MQQASTEDTFANLSRLSQKPGVRGTLVLSRDSGAIVQSSGLETADPTTEEDTAAASGNGIDGVADSRPGRFRSAEAVASTVLEFVAASSRMAQDLNGTKEDELKLLRMRTKRNELVIVPDARYIAVVIHDTPPA